MTTASFMPAHVEPRVQSFLSYVFERFPFYRSHFSQARWAPGDPVGQLLDRLPSLSEHQLALLQQDALSLLDSEQFLVDRTTGTTGLPKLRLATHRDDAAEAVLARRFFRTAGITPQDRVVALDIDSADLYMFYGDVLLDLGVLEFTFLTVSTNFRNVAADLAFLKPTVVIGTPTLFARLMPDLISAKESGQLACLRSAVYLGESMPSDLRASLVRDLTLEVFSFFGTTEIGSAGGECLAHDGVHIYTDAVIPTLLRPSRRDNVLSAEVAWTTLHFRDFPVVKYLSHDRLTITDAPCRCGALTPRIIDIRRTQEEVVLFGHKFCYDAFLQAVCLATGHPTLLRIEVSRCDPATRLSFILPSSCSRYAEEIQDSLRATDELGYFQERGFLELVLRFDDSSSGNGRKTPRVICMPGEEHGTPETSVLPGRRSFGRRGLSADRPVALADSEASWAKG